MNRNVNLFYFRKSKTRCLLFLKKVYQFSLIPSHSGRNDLCQKPFLTLSLFESQNSNCYYKQDLYYWKFDIQSIEKCFKTINTSSYKKEHIKVLFFLSSLNKIDSFKRHSFSGLIDSIGELLHIHNRISTSMTTALLS